MIDMMVVDLSRLQFALTALYHFLFVPLTMGLSMILVIMEATYVMTGGLGLALAFGILNAIWFEIRECERERMAHPLPTSVPRPV